MSFRKSRENPFEEDDDEDKRGLTTSTDSSPSQSQRSSVRELASNFERLQPGESLSVSSWTKTRTISGNSTITNTGNQVTSANTGVKLVSQSTPVPQTIPPRPTTSSVFAACVFNNENESDPFADDYAAYTSSSSSSDNEDNQNLYSDENLPDSSDISQNLIHVDSNAHESQSNYSGSSRQYPSAESFNSDQSRSKNFNHLSQSLDILSRHQIPSTGSVGYLSTTATTSPNKPIVPPRPQRTPGRSPKPAEKELHLENANTLLGSSSPEIRPPLPPRPSASRGASPEWNITQQTQTKSSAISASQGDLFGTSSLPRAPAPPVPDRPQHRYKNSASETTLFSKQPQQQEDRFSQLKIKEKVHMPITRYVNRRLPLVESLATSEFAHKGPIKTLAYSRLYAVTGSTGLRIWYLPTGENIKTVNLGNDTKVYSACFLPNVNMDLDGHRIWVGIDRGEILSIDIHSGDVIERRGLHNAPVTHMFRRGIQVFTLDENGGLKIWSPNEVGTLSLLSNRPRGIRIGLKQSCAHVVHHQLWTCSGKQVEAYSLEEDVASVFLKRFDVGLNVAAVSCIASLPALNQVYLGHDDGKISIYDTNTFEKRRTVHLGIYRITSMLGLPENQHLWVGYATGRISVYDPSRLGTDSSAAIDEANHRGWILLKDFAAYHNTGVSGIVYDESSLAATKRQNLITFSETGQIRIWDGLLAKDRQEATMKELQRDFCHYEPIQITMLTWNIDSRKPADLEPDSQDRQFLLSFISQHEGSEVYVFSFQELIDLESKSENAKQLFKGNKQSKDQANVDQRFKLWQERLTKTLYDAFPGAYRMLECRQLVGLFQCIFVKTNTSFSIAEVAATQVKTGLGGYHGNKGAIAIRFIVNDSSCCLVNSHLAAHQSHISARNNDIANILKDAQFPKLPHDSLWEQGGDGSMILDHENVFWMGDLNYRIDMTRPAVIEKVREYDWKSLWEHDQLLKQKRENPSFGLRDFDEGPLSFAPTFKYDRGTSQYDTSEKMRIPAYCDRILWRGSLVQQTHLNRYEVKISDHRPVGASFVIQIKQVIPQKKAEVYQSQIDQVNQLMDELVLKAKVRWVSHALGVNENQSASILNAAQGDLKYVLDYYIHEYAATNGSTVNIADH